MDENNAKIYLKLGELEFSIEGSPDYVAQQYKEMEKQLNLRKMLTGEGESDTSQKPASKKRPRTTTTKTKKSLQTTTKKFSQWLGNLPKTRDKLLVVGYFIQQNSKDNVFRVRDMDDILKKHGIHVANPYSLINNLVKSRKLLQQVSQEGKQKYFQLTKEGEKHIRNLLEARVK